MDALDTQTSELNEGLSEKKSSEETESRKLSEMRASHESAVETVHQVSLKINELDAQSRSLAERAAEEFNLDLAQQTKGSMNLPDDFDTASARERVNYLRGRLDSFGPVNLVAFSEYSEEKLFTETPAKSLCCTALSASTRYRA